MRETALFDCLNPACPCPQGGQAELPCLENTDVLGAQTDWPLCDTCLWPLSLVENVVPNEEFLQTLAEEAFDQAEVPALLRLRMICEEMLAREGYAGDGGIQSTGGQSLPPTRPRHEESTPFVTPLYRLSSFWGAMIALAGVQIPNSW